MIHVNASYLDLNSTINTTIIAQNWINVITRVSVPCFVMLSGAFTLSGRSVHNTQAFYKNAFYKMVIPFLVMWLFWGVTKTIKGILVGKSLSALILPWFHFSFEDLWFMPMIICLYLIAPGFAIIKDKVSQRTFTIVSILVLIWAVISQGTSDYVLSYSIGVVFAYAGWFLIGNILYEKKSDGRQFICLSLLVILALSIATVFFRINISQHYALDPYKAFFSPTVTVMSLLFFWLFKNLKIRRHKWIEWLSTRTFYIYLIHPLVLRVVLAGVNRLTNNILLKVIAGGIVAFLVSVFVSSIWIWIRKVIDNRFCIRAKINAW